MFERSFDVWFWFVLLLFTLVFVNNKYSIILFPAISLFYQQHNIS